MAISEEDLRDQIKVDYKSTYDVTGELDLPDFQQTLSYVKESATLQVKKDFADALMSLTVYANAPYRVQKISTTTLVDG